MTFIVTPTPNYGSSSVVEYPTQEAAKVAIDEALKAVPGRVFFLSEKIASYTATVEVISADVAPEVTAK